MLLGFMGLALAIAAAFTALIFSVNGLRTASNRGAHSEQTIAAANNAEKLLLDLETGERGYVITDSQRFLAPWASARTAFPAATARLETLVAGDAAQERSAASIRAAGNAYLRDWSLPLVAAEQRDPASARRLVATGRGKRRVDALRGLFSSLIGREQALAIARTSAANDSATTAITTTIAGLIVSVLILALLAALMGRSVLAPLERLRAAADRMAGGFLSVRIPRRGPPELAKLADSFNAMARTLEKSHSELRAATVRADEANLAKSEFLSRMSHELRTPLNAIIGYGQVLDMQLLDDRRRDDVDHILKAGRHLLALIDDVLDIARIEAGELTLSAEPVPIAESVAEVIALVAPTADQRGVHLGVDMSGLADDAHVYADRRLLAQVLLNLLSNAIKYNREGGRVDVSFAIPETDRVQMLVSDTGLGIPPAKLARLYEPFDRLGAEYTEVEGTGLGLALAKRLVEAMEGSLEVRSEPSHGTTFTVELAAVEAPDGGSRAKAGAAPAPVTGGELGHRSRRILYIEDNLSNLTLVERILEQQRDVEVIPAMQGTIGLELAREHRPDLIVLDLHLPDVPGSEVLRRLKGEEETREIPVVVLSADASKNQIERLLEAGASHYLTKPLDVREFLGVLAANLAGGDDTPAPELHGARIVIVDDVPTNVTLLSMILADWGYDNLVSTTDSSRAIELCLEERPDLLLLDLQMPTPNGYEVMEALRQRRNGDLSILVLSADLNDEVMVRARALGADDFVTKPFDFDELRRQVNALLQARRGGTRGRRLRSPR